MYGGLPYPYSTAAPISAGGILTPISLPVSSFETRPSPVISHHSQELPYVPGGHLPQQGLGITGPFPSNYPMTGTHDFNPYAQGEIGPGDPKEASHYSPQPRPTKRIRRAPRRTPPVRETPVSILPDPQGVERMEQERQRQSDIARQQQQELSRGLGGRRRRDPQAEEEDDFVETLRDENMSWKTISELFYQRFNKEAKEARLQMRLLRRRKERQARWGEDDVSTCLILSFLESDLGRGRKEEEEEERKKERWGEENRGIIPAEHASYHRFSCS